MGWNPIIDAIDDKERLMNQVPLTGVIFHTDNAKAWTELKKVAIMSSEWTWIKNHEVKFRNAYLAFIKICEGNDHKNCARNDGHVFDRWYDRKWRS